MTRIKICGIRELQHGITCYEHGANYLGFVFAESKRQIDPDTAKEIIAALPADIQKVGVFVNRPLDEMIAIADFCGLDMLQLHGQETYEDFRNSPYPIIKSVSIKPSGLAGKPDVPPADYLLFDTWHKDMAGGCGETFYWDSLKQYQQEIPFFLAGGLNAANVQEAIMRLNPFAVDISSGVETKGVKDHQKIIEFINRVKECGNNDL